VTIDMWLTAGVLVSLVVVLAKEMLGPAVAIAGGLVLLVVTGVVPPEIGFAGFSSTATITVAGLFVVARAIQDHLGLESVLRRMLGDGANERSSLARLALPVATASSVIANTPLVAGLAPMVRRWAEREGRPVSRYLMPLSFAAIIGGVVTTIGTSTTLLVSGLVERSTGEPFSLLEVTPVGLPVALAGTVVLVVLAPRVLPDRTTSGEAVAAAERDYTFRLSVESGGSVAGRTVEEAGLRHLDEVFLAEVDRKGRRIVPVTPTEVLEPGDELVFVGRVDQVRALETLNPGLVHAERAHRDQLEDTRTGLHEVVVGGNSRLLNRTLKEVAFRGRYDAAVLAIHRAGERIDAKLGEVRLQRGDSLLLEAGPDFAERWRDRGDFAGVVPLDDHLTEPSSRAPLVAATVLGMVALAAVGLLPTVVAVLLACAVLVASRTLTFFQAKDALDLDILLIVAGAIGLGAAAEESGLAGLGAEALASVASSSGYLVALLVVLLGTLLLTELVTNVAAAALMVPIALDVAPLVGADPRGFAVAVAIAASSSFLTPIGYQTNTLVYGLGGYRFGDYWRLGLPITGTVVIISLVVIPRVWG
jgi:di/tricarboxylate transporter